MNFIPFANPAASFISRKNEYLQAIERVIDSGYYILGTEVEHFEQSFAQWLCGKNDPCHCVGVGNGTDAIELILRGMCSLASLPPQVKPLIFTVSHTAVATVSAIERAGCVPCLVDVDEETYTMSPQSLEDAVQAVKNRQEYLPFAVIPVHLYGHACDIDSILDIAQKYGLKVIEDCAQAHGAVYKGKRAGTLGDAASFSFYPTKNLGAIGDGGASVTANEALAAEMRALRQYGWKRRYISDIAGINSRLDPMQAALLSVNLRYLDIDIAQRHTLAKKYTCALQDSSFVLPTERQHCAHAYHLYVIRHKQRDLLADFLKECHVGTGVHYPVPVHLQPAYVGRVLLAPRGLPITEKIANEILSLPLFPALLPEEQEHVITNLHTWGKEKV